MMVVSNSMVDSNVCTPYPYSSRAVGEVSALLLDEHQGEESMCSLCTQEPFKAQAMYILRNYICNFLIKYAKHRRISDLSIHAPQRLDHQLMQCICHFMTRVFDEEPTSLSQASIYSTHRPRHIAKYGRLGTGTAWDCCWARVESSCPLTSNQTFPKPSRKTDPMARTSILQQVIHPTFPSQESYPNIDPFH